MRAYTFILRVLYHDLHKKSIVYMIFLAKMLDFSVSGREFPLLLFYCLAVGSDGYYSAGDGFAAVYQ